MFKNITKKDKRTNLEKEIDSVLLSMSLLNPGTEEYTTMADNLEKLYKAKAQDRLRHISPDTIAVVAGNLAGLVMIMNYERANVISTKAIGFVLRGRA